MDSRNKREYKAVSSFNKSKSEQRTVVTSSYVPISQIWRDLLIGGVLGIDHQRAINCTKIASVHCINAQQERGD